MFSSSFCEHELTFLVNEWIPRIVEFTDIKHYEAYELLSLKFDSVVYTYYFLGQYFDISFKIIILAKLCIIILRLWFKTKQ